MKMTVDTLPYDPVEEKKRNGEGKYAGSDSSESGHGEGWGLLERARRCFESGAFQEELDDFARKFAWEFQEAIEEEEKAREHTHRIRYSEIHAQYLRRLEGLLSGFLEEEGRSAEELFSDLKDAIENNYTALFEEHEYHGFARSILAAMEYQEFYRLMLRTARERDSSSSSGSAGPRNSRRESRRKINDVEEGALDLCPPRK